MPDADALAALIQRATTAIDTARDTIASAIVASQPKPPPHVLRPHPQSAERNS